MIQTESILKQLDSVLARYSEFLGFETEEWSRATVNELLTRSHAAVQRLAPPGSAYLARCAEALEASGSDVYRLELLVGVIAALRSDFALGALQPIRT